MQYDIIFILGEEYFDHPLCGAAILKRLLEKEGYSVGIIEMPGYEDDITRLGTPKLFFGISSGSIDSMLRNYTPLKKPRSEDIYAENIGHVPDRAVIVYSNWVKARFKDSIIVLGGVEATLRRFTHYDYWDNGLRKPILFDSRADILAYGSAEKQILEIAKKCKEGIESNNKPKLSEIEGTCIISKSIPKEFKILPSFSEVKTSDDKFCDMQNMFSNNENLAQKVDNRYALQYKSPKYTSKDIDSYYELDFTRKVPKHLRGFEFSVVTHRGCIGECNFCSLRLTQGNRIISRSEESILKEMEKITKLTHFKGNIDDLGGPSANMYGMDCNLCKDKFCMECKNLDRSNKKLLQLYEKAGKIQGINNIFIRSGVRYELCSKEYIKELPKHIADTLRIAPEHTSKNVLKLMNKDKGDIKKFIEEFNKTGTKKELAFYFMVAHPGSSLKNAEELSKEIRKLKNVEAVQVFTPNPMTVSTCMYFTGLNPKNKEKVYIPYTYNEKKTQKNIAMGNKPKHLN
jgi:uncharacterized radical SAM protein YgiQ